MNNIREFYELINEYPWTTFLVFLMILTLIGEIVQMFKRS